FRDRGTKFAEYEIDGVREYWVIDPNRKQADFLFLSEGKRFERKLPDKRGFYHSAVLKGFRIKVEWLWQSPLPKIADVLKEIRQSLKRKK
ncbi:MAG: Uma2 family endonuclease, partial [Armatimonadetes bacterium]|nr:Uma2 family endonuclease [Armatimonadota bacterium]